MKNTILFIVLFITLSGFSQIPEGYYNNTEYIDGEELKTALYNIIKGHKEFPYTSSSTDVWDILKESDRDPANADNVILIYTGWSVEAGLPGQEYDNGNGWSREHVWAKSRGDFGTDLGPGTDAHHLRPCDISVNSARNNRWFNYCDVEYYDNGVATGSYTSSTDWFWQPRDEVIGDIARMIFYMATRYEGENGEPNLEVIDYIPSDQYTNDPVHALLSTLLEWNEEDPVDDFERNRNEVVYSYQGNRNPFIDHPEFVQLIYNPSPAGLSQNLEIEKIKIYPNPAFNILNVDASGEFTVEIYSIIGAKITQSNLQQIDISNFEEGVYFVVIKNEYGATIKSEKIIKK